MRIAIVSPYDLGRYGGVQHQVMQLADWLRSAGHDAWVVGPGDGGEGTIGVGKSLAINANGSTTPIALALSVIAKVRDAVASADVVHVHEPLMPMVSLAATLRVNQPSVGTFHADAPRWVRYAYRRLLGIRGGRVGRLNVITAVSPVAAAPLSNLVQHRIVPNGLDTVAFHSERKTEGRVVFIGRDEPRKGLDAFLAAALSVTNSYPNASFIVAGTNKKMTHGPCEYVGRPNEDDKRALLSSAEVFVAPHRGGESFGIVIAEAMAAGCAVVASALPAFTHVLGDTGILVPPADPFAIARAVEQLLKDDELRGSLQMAARNRARRFDRSTTMAGYLAAYRDAVDDRG